MSYGSMALTLKFCSSFGTYLFYHLASNRACLAGGQVTVVTALEVDADFACCLHEKAVPIEN